MLCVPLKLSQWKAVKAKTPLATPKAVNYNIQQLNSSVGTKSTSTHFNSERVDV